MTTVISGDTGIDKVQDGVVVTADLADGAVTAAKLADGALVEDSANSIGYGTGAGGTVTQATSKGTAVTLNKPTGQITMNNASLSAGGVVIFSVNNTLMTTNDTVVLTLGSVGTGLTYNCWCPYSVNGAFYVALQNISGGALAEAVVVKFAIIKGATA